MAKKSLVAQIAAMSEGAINRRIVGGEITQRALAGALSLKDRVERVVQGLADVEERVVALEQRVEELETAARKPAARKPAARKAPAPKVSAAKASTKTPARAKPAPKRPPA